MCTLRLARRSRFVDSMRVEPICRALPVALDILRASGPLRDGIPGPIANVFSLTACQGWTTMVIAIDIDKYVTDLVTEGWTVIPDAMPPDEVAATRRAMNELIDAEADSGRRLGTQTDDLRVVFNAHGKHPHFYGLALRNRAPLDVARRLLGDDLVLYDFTIRVPFPTGRKDTEKYGGHFHVDWAPYTVTPFEGGKHYPMAIQSAWAISDFSDRGGGTVLYPKSHLSLSAPHSSGAFEDLPPGYVFAEAPAGSVFLWDSAIWHTGGINNGTVPRYTVIGYMQRGWIKGFNDQVRKVPAAAAAGMTSEERRLFGLEAVIPPNTHLKGMSADAIAALSSEDRSVLGLPLL